MVDPLAPAAPETASRPRPDAPAPPGEAVGADGHPAPAAPEPELRAAGSSAAVGHSPVERSGHGLASLARKVGAALRRRWKIALAVTAAVVLLAGGVGYFVINHVIRSRLASLVRKNLDGELVGGSVSYRPPLGFVLRDARVVGDDGRGGKVELLRVARLDCKLAKFPGGKGPVVIESLVVREPAVHLISGERKKEEAPPCSDCSAEPPPKLSQRVQIRHLQLQAGSLSLHDRTRPDVPDLTVRNVSAEVGPPQAAGGAQPLQVSVKDGPADLQAKGSFQEDDLLLGLDDLALDVRLDPASRQSTLPASLAELARRYGVTGALSLHGKGEVPLSCPQLCTFDGALQVDDASARPPGAGAALEHVRLKILADTRSPATGPSAPPMAPPAAAPSVLAGLHAKVAYCEASYAGTNLKIDGGEFSEDRGRGTWRVARLEGHFSGSLADAKRGTDPRYSDEKPATQSAVTSGGGHPSSGGPSGAPTTRPGEPPGAPPGAPVLRGRIDFTAAAGGPLGGPLGAPATQPSTRPGVQPVEPLHYEIILLPRDVALQPKSFPLPIEHIGGGMIRVDRGAATAGELTGTYGGDKLVLKHARVPFPENLRDLSRLWKLETRIEEMSGTLTCYQPGPVYPKGIDCVFRAIHPQGTVSIAGRLTLNHRLPMSGRTGKPEPKPKDDFALDIASDGGVSFALSDLGIPITHVRGKAQVDPVAIVIGTDGLRPSVVEGHSMGGTVTVHMDVSPRTDRDPAVFRGEGWLRDVNMTLLCKLLDVQDEQLSKAGGKGYLHARFAIQGEGAPRPPIDTFRAQGELEVIGANFWEDPVVGVIAAAIRGGKPGAGGKATTQQGVGDAAAVFHVADRVVTLDRAAVNSPTVGIQGSGTVSFDKQLNLELTATPIGSLKAAIRQANPNPAGEVAGDIAGVIQGVYRAAAGGLLYQYRVTGPASHPNHELVPAPTLSDPGAFLFGRMADPTDGDLLDAVRSAGSTGRGAQSGTPKK